MKVFSFPGFSTKNISIVKIQPWWQGVLSHRPLVVINLSSVHRGPPGEAPRLAHHLVLAGQTLPPQTLQVLELASQSQHLG